MTWTLAQWTGQAKQHASPQYTAAQTDPDLQHILTYAGGISKEGTKFFRRCRDATDNKFNARASDLSSWSRKGFSNFFLQSLSLANLIWALVIS